MEFVVRFFCQNDEESKHLDNAEKELEGAGIKFYVGHYEGCREWFFDKNVLGNIEIIAMDDYEPPDLKPYDEVYPQSS